MATKRAKILNPQQIKQILTYLDAHSPVPESDCLKVLLSFRAGLRACEIASLTPEAVTTPEGRIAKTIQIFSHMTKNGKERSIPMHPDIAQAIRRFLTAYPDARRFAIGRSGKYQSVNTLTVWFHRLYRELGYQGCSSHSGRRTFITQLARRVSSSGGSIRDVQIAAGHARLETTELYIEPSSRVRDMIQSLGDPSFEHADFDDFAPQGVLLRAETMRTIAPRPSSNGRRAAR